MHDFHMIYYLKIHLIGFSKSYTRIKHNLVISNSCILGYVYTLLHIHQKVILKILI